MYKDCDMSYYAGFFDGEGCIMIKKPSKACMNYILEVRITNTYRPILEEYARIFGGTVHGGTRLQAQYKEKWQWCISSKKAFEFLKAIVPFLRLKRPEAELAIEFQGLKKATDNQHTNKCTPEKVRERAGYYWRMRGLKNVI
ncbi:hypothetical protein LCGC14_1706750 [marine sediment metagenome]|uniref:Homing endonuclease LAGLIDADG domain-containing protein n=1 Tax=marine sediment metagenome TaxID=412755 RepID=A0A0F9I406_9ZZZZ